MNIIIEIVAGHELPVSRMVGQGDKRSERIHQNAYIHLGGAFPTQFKIPLEKATDMYAVGKYGLSPSSFKVGQYGDLEINRFELSLVSLKNG